MLWNAFCLHICPSLSKLCCYRAVDFLLCSIFWTSHKDIISFNPFDRIFFPLFGLGYVVVTITIEYFHDILQRSGARIIQIQSEFSLKADLSIFFSGITCNYLALATLIQVSNNCLNCNTFYGNLCIEMAKFIKDTSYDVLNLPQKSDSHFICIASKTKIFNALLGIRQHKQQWEMNSTLTEGLSI